MIRRPPRSTRTDTLFPYTTLFRSIVGQLQRRLAAELHDDTLQNAAALLLARNADNVLGGQRLEVEAVRGVVIRRHRLRIAVHHDGFIAGLAEGIGGVDEAVVELDDRADAVRPAAGDHHHGAGAGCGLASRSQWPIELGRS